MKVLTTAQLQEVAPSIFATKAHSSRSERYAYCSTIDVLAYLRKHADLVPVQAFQSRVHKDKTRVKFTKHLVRLRERKYIDMEMKPNTLVPEVVLTNGHDGSSCFQLEAGIFRFICSNGLVVKSSDFASLRVYHSGKVRDKVNEAVAQIGESFPNLMRVTKEWDAIKLTQRQRINFAKEALAIRFHGIPPITTEQALEVRRNEDEAPTLWRTFNVLQENLLMGGIQGARPSGRRVTVRAVTSVNNSLHHNRGLWQLAEAVASRN
jgi:hypothetical protein